MPRISCIVPVLDRLEEMEPTLVSLLENRPRDAEILLVFSRPYDDPYQLKDEVRFLNVPAGTGFLKAANAGILEAQSPVVHLLDVGCQATAGWADAALDAFRDPRVAAVAPALCEPAAHQLAHTLGWNWTPHDGPTRVSGSDAETLAIDESRAVVAPTVRAGFYRTMVLELLGGKLPAVCGDEWSTVDLGLIFDAIGYTTHVRRDSMVAIAEGQVALPAPSAFEAGANAERLYARNLQRTSASERYAGHPAGLLGEFVQGLVKPATFARALGRLSVWMRNGEWKNHRISMTETRAVCESMFAQIRETQAKVEKAREARRAA